tara:strand:+ start:276 stop:611 length:336 start_codon:yes stop_codon:yes gene_type:complete
MNTKKTKKPKPSGLDFIVANSNHFKLNYCLRFLIKNLSSIDTIKLTVAPIAAKTTVLKMSSEYKFGTILKKIPPAVFILVEISICIDNYTLLPAPLIPVEGLRASSLLVVI